MRLDLAVNPIPHVCVHVVAPKGARAWTSNPAKRSEREAFQAEVALRARVQLRAQRFSAPLEGPVRVRVLYWRRGRGDAPNFDKDLLDALTKAGVWVDDRQVKDWHGTLMAMGPNVEPRIVVDVEPFDAQLSSSTEGQAMSP
jgi:Holliday junction resolvase RusA-like endonuclease